MSTTPDAYLGAGIGETGIPEGFDEKEKYRLDTPTSASRTYFSEKQTLTVSLTKTEDATRNFEAFKQELQGMESDSGKTWLSNPSCGGASAQWKSGNRRIMASAVVSKWRAHVEWEFSSTAHEEQAKPGTRRLLKSLCASIPHETENTNLLTGDDAIHCQWLIPVMLSTAASSLSKQELRELVQKQGITAEDLGSVIFNPTHAAFLKKYRTEIIAAAEETQLTPEIISSAILSEVRGLDQYLMSTRPMTNFIRSVTGWIRNKAPYKPVQIPVDLVGFGLTYLWDNTLDYLFIELQKVVGLDEELRDWVASKFRDDVSVGLFQRQVDSLIHLQVHKRIPELASMPDATLRGELRNWLLDEKRSIRLGAHFIRVLANKAAAYQGPKKNALKSWMETKACGHFDLALFGQHAREWTPLHISFLGWKYNTGHLDSLDNISGVPVWGDMFVLSYHDIVLSDVMR